MTFVERFVHFTVNLSDTDRSVNTTFRFKIPKHPREPNEFFWTRVLAFCHRHTETLAFAPDIFDDRVPTIGAPQPAGGFDTWIEIGVPSKDKLRRALRDGSCTGIYVYFTQPSDIEAFCKHLKGSTENWIERISFFLFTPECVSPFLTDTSTRHQWSLTIVDRRIYLETNNTTIEGEAQEIRMWDEFQKFISKPQ